MNQVPRLKKPSSHPRKRKPGQHKPSCACSFCQAKAAKAEREAKGIVRPPSRRQKRFLAALLDPASTTHLNVQSSLELADYSGTEEKAVLANTTVRETILKALDAAGVNDTLFSQRLREGLDAEKTEFFSNKGIVTDERNVIDWGTRHRAMELYAQLRGVAQEQIVDQRRQLIVHAPVQLTPEQWRKMFGHPVKEKEPVPTKEPPTIEAETVPSK